MAKTQAKLLVIDDDSEFVRSFQNQVDTDYDVACYDTLPVSINEHQTKPDLVLIDVNLKADNSFSIYQKLREDYISTDTPVLFLTDNAESTESNLQVYRSNCDDLIRKGIGLREIKLKIDQAIQSAKEKSQLQERLAEAKKITMSAMMETGELGEIIKSMEASFLCKDVDSLAKLMLESTTQMGLHASVKIYVELNNPQYFSYDRKPNDAECEFIDLARHTKRIVDLGQRTLFNYEHVSLLIRNMPVDDELRYGRLKDNLCIIMNAMENKIVSLNMERISAIKQQKIMSTISVLTRMMQEMDSNNTSLSTKFASIIENLEANIAAELVSFSLLEKEESVLMNHIHETISAAQGIFDQSIELEKTYSIIMSKLINSLK